jgi:hypothetical protein
MIRPQYIAALEAEIERKGRGIAANTEYMGELEAEIKKAQ